MKKAFLALLPLALLAVGVASAVPLSSLTYRVLYTDGRVTTTEYYTLSSSLTKSIKGIMISHSGTQDIKLAVGAVGSEVDMLTIPAFQSAAVYYPLVVSQAQRVSIKALASLGDTGAAIGKGTFNLLFN